VSSAGIRTRARHTKLPGGKLLSKTTGAILLQGTEQTLGGRQKTVSQNHERGRDGRYHSGGPFYTVDVRGDYNPMFVTIKHPTLTQVYKGPVHVPPGGFPDVSDKGINEIRSEDTSDLDPYGATAIAAISPVNPCSNVAQQFGEVHQQGIVNSLPGIPSWKNRTKIAKAAGSEYLNAVFGWLPLVDEIGEVTKAVRFSDTIQKQFQKGAGRNTRREFEFDTEYSESESSAVGRVSTGNIGLSISNWYTGSPTVITRTEKSATRRWFSGAFTYPAMPDSDSSSKLSNAARQADHLYGLALTPDLVWELTPWSWAIDWFSNAGEVITNFQNFSLYGQVMRYGYIMEETTTKIKYSIDRCGLITIPDRSVPPSSVTITTKVRRPANPFGFGLSWDGLSPQQLLITAALGITRL